MLKIFWPKSCWVVGAAVSHRKGRGHSLICAAAIVHHLNFGVSRICDTKKLVVKRRLILKMESSHGILNSHGSLRKLNCNYLHPPNMCIRCCWRQKRLQEARLPAATNEAVVVPHGEACPTFHAQIPPQWPLISCRPRSRGASFIHICPLFPSHLFCWFFSDFNKSQKIPPAFFYNFRIN